MSSLRPVALAAALVWSALGTAVVAPPALAQGPDATRYAEPSADIRAVLDAKVLPTFQLSPDQHTVAVMEMQRYRRIGELARPTARLAGLRIDPAANGPQLVPAIQSLKLRDVGANAAEREVKLPTGGGFHSLRFSPDGQRFVLKRRTANGTELWWGETAKAAVQPLRGVKLNGVLEGDVSWINSDELVVLAVPEKRPAEPHFDAPTGPAVQESMGRKSPERTLQDLLRNSQDEAHFVWQASSVLKRVQLSTGSHREISAPGLFANVTSLGTQGALLTERLVGPFSYQVAWYDFGREVEVRNAEGRVLRKLGNIKLKEGVPVEGVITGPRNYFASPLADASVYWVEALDNGDQRNKVPHRDRLMRLDAPYTGEAREVHRTVGRLAGLNFLEVPQRALISEFDRDRLWISADVLALDGSAKPLRVQDRSWRDRYKDPGSPMLRTLANGRSVIRVDGDQTYLLGMGASAQGERPFIDRMSLADGKTVRLFQSAGNVFERPMALLDGNKLLTSRESANEPPNLVLRSGADFSQSAALTQVADPTPQLRQIKRELVKFKRGDGVELSFWLYLPPDYKPGERRPTFVWAYPLEFTDASTAGQVSGSPNRFSTFGGATPLMLLLDGYVVLMDATMPVVGDPRTVNDSFVEQITANAKAIIDKAVDLGVSDAKEMVVGGHSYGAFMTANLLAHTDLFKAGIARSGAYNRSLTPFGFQSERRTYWEAQDVYQKLSPFNYAQQLKEPILLIHGEQDDNPGTFPIQSQRFYQALAGNGAQVRYVTLPFESHGYSARESVGHTLREMSDWMKRWTRDPRTAR